MGFLVSSTTLTFTTTTTTTTTTTVTPAAERAVDDNADADANVNINAYTEFYRCILEPVTKSHTPFPVEAPNPFPRFYLS